MTPSEYPSWVVASTTNAGLRSFIDASARRNSAGRILRIHPIQILLEIIRPSFSTAASGQRAAHEDCRRLDAGELDVHPPRCRPRRRQREPDHRVSLGTARAAAYGKAEAYTGTHSAAPAERPPANPNTDGRRWSGHDGRRVDR